MKTCFLWALLVGSSIHARAQDYPRTDINLEKLIDEIFPVQDLDLNYEDLYDNLAQILSNPLDLNNVTREQMRSLMVVPESDINSFFQYREENGPILSVYELQAIPGWTRQTFDNIVPFVRVIEAQSRFNTSIFQRMAEEKNNYLLLRVERGLEMKKGYSPQTDSAQRYAGSPDRYYIRYRVSRSNDFSFGFTLEKDPGEAMTWVPSKNQFGFDYFSIHGQVQNKGRLKNLVIGDYQCQFGQGLIMGSSFGFGKNAETITTVRRSNLGFLPYTSLSENLFLRGAAATVSLSGNVFAHGFISKTLRDGNLTTLADESPQTATSLSNAGLHRTLAELEDRKRIEELDIGGVLQYKTQMLDAGIIYHRLNFQPGIVRTETPYNQFAFSGSENQNVGAYVNFSWANFTFFSEVAQTISHGRGFTTGILGNLTKSLEVSLLYRNFDRDFYSFYSNALSENTAAQNERGFYWGWKYKFNKKYSASGYFDVFNFPWLRYRGYAPSEGNEWLLRFNYTPSKAIVLFLQARSESKIRNLPGESTLYKTAVGEKRNFWINCDYAAPPWLTFKTRVQFSDYTLGASTTRGFAVIQDVNFSLGRVTLSTRYALFDTDDYDNRIYAYERNMWLAFSFPAYYGVGTRTYIMLQYKLSRQTDVWFKWSQTRYSDRNEIGTGTETIPGNTGNDVKFQARIRF
jgi:hypothetical protein